MANAEMWWPNGGRLSGSNNQIEELVIEINKS